MLCPAGAHGRSAGGLQPLKTGAGALDVGSEQPLGQEPSPRERPSVRQQPGKSRSSVPRAAAGLRGERTPPVLGAEEHLPAAALGGSEPREAPPLRGLSVRSVLGDPQEPHEILSAATISEQHGAGQRQICSGACKELSPPQKTTAGPARSRSSSLSFQHLLLLPSCRPSRPAPLDTSHPPGRALPGARPEAPDPEPGSPGPAGLGKHVEPAPSAPALTPPAAGASSPRSCPPGGGFAPVPPPASPERGAATARRQAQHKQLLPREAPPRRGRMCSACSCSPFTGAHPGSLPWFKLYLFPLRLHQLHPERGKERVPGGLSPSAGQPVTGDPVSPSAPAAVAQPAPTRTEVSHPKSQQRAQECSQTRRPPPRPRCPPACALISGVETAPSSPALLQRGPCGRSEEPKEGSVPQAQECSRCRLQTEAEETLPPRGDPVALCRVRAMRRVLGTTHQAPDLRGGWDPASPRRHGWRAATPAAPARPPPAAYPGLAPFSRASRAEQSPIHQEQPQPRATATAVTEPRRPLGPAPAGGGTGTDPTEVPRHRLRCVWDPDERAAPGPDTAPAPWAPGEHRIYPHGPGLVSPGGRDRNRAGRAGIRAPRPGTAEARLNAPPARPDRERRETGRAERGYRRPRCPAQGRRSLPRSAGAALTGQRGGCGQGRARRGQAPGPGARGGRRRERGGAGRGGGGGCTGRGGGVPGGRGPT
ncbi:basic proline-rich protein-like [Strigops habroptila]|uniref:basic proline-rich protein-like n=1 Tax=Strigops habroptila TaxID=2489341 RepID=UPI0011CF8C10|nr:basic proline-rich protein-like [Strigops habroptila]